MLAVDLGSFHWACIFHVGKAHFEMVISSWRSRHLTHMAVWLHLQLLCLESVVYRLLSVEQSWLRYNLCRGETDAEESLGVGSSNLRDCEAKEDPAIFRGKISFKRRMTLACFLWSKSEECYVFLGSLNFFFSYGYNVCGTEIKLSVLRKLRHFLAYIHSKKSTLGFSPLWFLVTGTENVVLNESLEKFR